MCKLDRDSFGNVKVPTLYQYTYSLKESGL
jgi:hypothetical protein